MATSARQKKKLKKKIAPNVGDRAADRLHFAAPDDYA